jgi:hypothetical protein
MPVGKEKPAGGYRAGKKGSYGCDGYPTVSADGTVHGCHPTKARAASQARAIWASTTAKKFVTKVEKSMVTEGDFVMYMGEEDEIMVGRVEYVMTNPGLLGLPGSEYALEYAEDDKPIIVRKYEEEDGAWEEEPYVCYHRMSEVIKIESLSVSVDLIMEMGSSDSEIPEPSTETMMAMYDAQMGKADKPNYEDMLDRPGDSNPSNMDLYNRIKQEARTKFDVYPSAVANAWVVAEYKRRGGTYKSEKRERSMETRQNLAESGAAMPDGSYPIVTGEDLRNAIQSVGRAKDYDKAKAHIMRRARELGMIDMLPDSWRNMARKGMTPWGGSIFDLNPFVK